MKSLADHAKTLGSSNSGAIVVDRVKSYSLIFVNFFAL